MNKCLIAIVSVVLSLFAEAAPVLSFDSTSVMIDGKRTYLVSGEFHYFRVPQADWRRRMRLLKDVGGNCLATYVPWIVHEPEEGKIVFGDTPQRDLEKFLRIAKEEGLMVIIRPGPYQYSELANNGLPTWLVENYPEIHLKQPDGQRLKQASVDYNHPTFLAKARPYFRAVAKVLKPHLAANGGPVVLTQLDNELTGIHVWFGYQPNEQYYADCAKYLETLKNWLIEDGIGGPYCHNAGGAQMSASYKTCADRLGNKDFLLGYDHYYGLFQSDREAPVPYYFFDALFACDILRGWGYPPVGFEIQCGTIGDVPPILKEDLLAAWMLNLAAGMKGINYYVFTGGPNFPGTTGIPEMEMYDYHAPVGPDGTVRPTYEALREFGAFVKGHPEFLEAERLTSVRVGLEWQHAAHLAPFDEGFNRYGMFYALMQTDYSPEYFLLDREIPLDGKPLVLAGVTSMGAEAQRRVATFVEKGGKLLVAPDFPRQDLAGKTCEILATRFGRVGTPGRPHSLGVELIDKTWKQQFFAQADRVAAVLAKFGAKPVVRSSNRNVFATAYRLKDGRTGVFALNLRSGAQETVVSLPTGDSAALRLAPMSVRYRILSPMTLKDLVDAQK